MDDARVAEIDQMKLHLLGPGKIGSLLAHHLRLKNPALPITILFTNPGSSTRFRQKYELSRDKEYPGIYRGLSLKFLSPKSRETNELVLSTSTEYWVQNYYGRLPRDKNYAEGHPALEDITSLIVATKAPQTTESLKILKNRLNRNSTIFILQNGMGVVDEIIDQVFPDPETRPTFILGTTNHGVKGQQAHHRNYNDDDPSWSASPKPQYRSHAFYHVGVGEMHYGILPTIPKQTSSQSDSTLDLLKQMNSLSPDEFDVENFQYQAAMKDLPLSTHHLLRLLGRLTHLGPVFVPWNLLLLKQLIKLPVNAVINTITSVLGRQNFVCLEKEAIQIAKSVSRECGAIYSRLFGYQQPDVTESVSTSNKAPPQKDRRARLAALMRDVDGQPSEEALQRYDQIDQSDHPSAHEDLGQEERKSSTTSFPSRRTSFYYPPDNVSIPAHSYHAPFSSVSQAARTDQSPAELIGDHDPAQDYILPPHLEGLSSEAIFESIINTARLTADNHSSMAADIWTLKKHMPQQNRVASDVLDQFTFESAMDSFVDDDPSIITAPERSPSSTEIKYISGYLEKLAASVGVKTPTITTLAHMVVLREKCLPIQNPARPHSLHKNRYG